VSYLDDLRDHPRWGETAAFYREGTYHVEKEILTRCSQDGSFTEDMNDLVTWLSAAGDTDFRETVPWVHRLFFPEGGSLFQQRDRNVSDLRERRKVRVSDLNTEPVTDPSREILFTSNVMLTVPLPGMAPEEIALPKDLLEKVKEVGSEEQIYWYDHPIPIGIGPDRNETIYGMRGLQEAVRFEIARGNMSEDHRVTTVLSVSTTHSGLQGVAKSYLEEELQKAGGLEHLEIYMFTEAETQRLADEVVVPALEQFLEPDDVSPFREVFGVDGKYGRHYSFLKALPALWQVLVDPGIRATFKIDLDQVFPQDILVDETGRSAFEHLMTPLWGARGEDGDGSSVELGMLAGALVNESDIGRGLFTPDVPWPPETSTSTPTSTGLTPDQWVFFSKLPRLCPRKRR